MDYFIIILMFWTRSVFDEQRRRFSISFLNGCPEGLVPMLVRYRWI